MISKNQIKFIRQLEMKKYRSREGLFVAEGPKVVGDLVRRYDAKAIYATDGWNPPADVSQSLVERITDDELHRISFLQHPQHVLALFPIPESDSSSSLSHLTSSLSLVLDGDNIYQQPLSQNGIIVMGNEGNGISHEIRTKVNRRLLIPRFRTGDSAESLNVAIATAITCSEFRRR